MHRVTSQIGNSALISTVNSRLVLQAVRTMQPTYRAAVARTTRLKPATVTGIVNELLEQRLLQETPVPGEVGPRGGRPPLMLQVNGDAKRILAIDLEPDVIRVALTNILVEMIEFKEELIDRFSAPETVCAKIIGLCREVLGRSRRDTVLGVGLSLPGLIDPEHGVLLSSTNMPKWRDVPVRQMLAKELKLPIKVERSIHLAALHERWADPSQHLRNALVLSLRTGIGVSLMHQGEIYIGSRGFDGEIGHTVVEIDGRPCECGGRGCLETFVSASAICDRAEKLMAKGRGRGITARLERGERLRPELIYRLAKEGDADCADIVRDVGRYIGIAVSNMVNLFAPDDVVICGSIDTADELTVEAVRRQMEQSALPKIRDRVTVRLARAKEKACVLGAAAFVAGELFDLPKLGHSITRDSPGRVTTVAN